MAMASEFNNNEMPVSEHSNFMSLMAMSLAVYKFRYKALEMSPRSIGNFEFCKLSIGVFIRCN